MQLFRYIAYIWEGYEKEQEMKRPGISKTKGFRYPPILPVLFYDGMENWTAAAGLHEQGERRRKSGTVLVIAV